jgi:hypothetical protein
VTGTHPKCVLLEGGNPAAAAGQGLRQMPERTSVGIAEMAASAPRPACLRLPSATMPAGWQWHLLRRVLLEVRQLSIIARSIYEVSQSVACAHLRAWRRGCHQGVRMPCAAAAPLLVVVVLFCPAAAACPLAPANELRMLRRRCLVWQQQPKRPQSLPQERRLPPEHLQPSQRRAPRVVADKPGLLAARSPGANVAAPEHPPPVSVRQAAMSVGSRSWRGAL